MKKCDTKVKIPLIITAINFGTHLIPLFVVVPLIFLIFIFGNKLGLDIISSIFGCMFVISSLVYVIGVALAPIVQIVLAIVATINKKWWLLTIHIVSAIMLGVGIMLAIKIYEIMLYAT